MKKALKLKLMTALILLLVVGMTGCSGDFLGFLNDDNDINLDGKYDSVQDYFTFSYPGNWNVIDNLSLSGDEVNFYISLTNLSRSLIESTNGLVFLTSNRFHLFTINYSLSPDRKIYSEEKFWEEIDKQEQRYLEEIDFPYGNLETVDREDFELGGVPARRLILYLDDIDSEELMDLIDDVSFINYIPGSFLNRFLGDYKVDVVIFLHNEQIHSIQYITPDGNYSRNLLNAIYDSFQFE